MLSGQVLENLVRNTPVAVETCRNGVAGSDKQFAQLMGLCMVDPAPPVME